MSRLSHVESVLVPDPGKPRENFPEFPDWRDRPLIGKSFSGIKSGLLVKVTLRNLIKDLHFVGPNMWTNDRENAFDFEHMEPAVEMAILTGLQDMELVLSFSNIPGEVHLAMATAAQIISTPSSDTAIKPTIAS